MVPIRATLFDPTPLSKDLALRNRVVMAPMTTWSANDDGTVSLEEEDYYRRRVSGVGMVITGCTHVTPNGIGFTGEFASYDDGFLPSLTRLASAAKSGGAPAILQIFHAGNKALPDLVPGGDVVSSSAVPVEAGLFNPALTPRALTDGETLEIVDAFGATTRRAIEAGFDGVELHGAHGFLIQNFFSPHANRRDDAWGGSLENRMRFPLAVVAAVQEAIAAHAAGRPFMLGYRISPEEPNEGGLRIEDTLVLTDRLIEAGIDYLHGSLSSALQAKPIGHDDGPTIVEILRDRIAGRIRLIVAGQVKTPDQAQTVLDHGADLVAIGQALVMDPHWVQLAEARRSSEIADAIVTSDVARLAIPQKLWAIIDGTPGWFTVRKAA